MRRDRRDENYEPDMPPIDGGYLISYLFEVGPTLDSGPVTHSELRAFQANVGVVLQPWEIRMIRSLSCDYLAESHRALDANAPAPWKFVPDLSVVANSLKQSMRSLAQL